MHENSECAQGMNRAGSYWKPPHAYYYPESSAGRNWNANGRINSSGFRYNQYNRYSDSRSHSHRWHDRHSHDRDNFRSERSAPMATGHRRFKGSSRGGSRPFPSRLTEKNLHSTSSSSSSSYTAATSSTTSSLARDKSSPPSATSTTVCKPSISNTPSKADVTPSHMRQGSSLLISSNAPSQVPIHISSSSSSTSSSTSTSTSTTSQPSTHSSVSVPTASTSSAPISESRSIESIAQNISVSVSSSSLHKMKFIKRNVCSNPIPLSTVSYCDRIPLLKDVLHNQPQVVLERLTERSVRRKLKHDGLHLHRHWYKVLLKKKTSNPHKISKKHRDDKSIKKFHKKSKLKHISLNPDKTNYKDVSPVKISTDPYEFENIPESKESKSSSSLLVDPKVMSLSRPLQSAYSNNASIAAMPFRQSGKGKHSSKVIHQKPSKSVPRHMQLFDLDKLRTKLKGANFGGSCTKFKQIRNIDVTKSLKNNAGHVISETLDKDMNELPRSPAESILDCSEDTHSSSDTADTQAKDGTKVQGLHPCATDDVPLVQESSSDKDETVGNVEKMSLLSVLGLTNSGDNKGKTVDDSAEDFPRMDLKIGDFIHKSEKRFLDFESSNCRGESVVEFEEVCPLQKSIGTEGRDKTEMLKELNDTDCRDKTISGSLDKLFLGESKSGNTTNSEDMCSIRESKLGEFKDKTADSDALCSRGESISGKSRDKTADSEDMCSVSESESDKNKADDSKNKGSIKESKSGESSDKTSDIDDMCSRRESIKSDSKESNSSDITADSLSFLDKTSEIATNIDSKSVPNRTEGTVCNDADDLSCERKLQYVEATAFGDSVEKFQSKAFAKLADKSASHTEFKTADIPVSSQDVSSMCSSEESQSADDKRIMVDDSKLKKLHELHESHTNIDGDFSVTLFKPSENPSDAENVPVGTESTRSNLHKNTDENVPMGTESMRRDPQIVENVSEPRNTTTEGTIQSKQSIDMDNDKLNVKHTDTEEDHLQEKVSIKECDVGQRMNTDLNSDDAHMENLTVDNVSETQTENESRESRTSQITKHHPKNKCISIIDSNCDHSANSVEIVSDELSDFGKLKCIKDKIADNPIEKDDKDSNVSYPIHNCKTEKTKSKDNQNKSLATNASSSDVDVNQSVTISDDTMVCKDSQPSSDLQIGSDQYESEGNIVAQAIISLGMDKTDDNYSVDTVSVPRTECEFRKPQTLHEICMKYVSVESLNELSIKTLKSSHETLGKDGKGKNQAEDYSKCLTNISGSNSAIPLQNTNANDDDDISPVCIITSVESGAHEYFVDDDDSKAICKQEIQDNDNNDNTSIPESTTALCQSYNNVLQTSRDVLQSTSTPVLGQQPIMSQIAPAHRLPVGPVSQLGICVPATQLQPVILVPVVKQFVQQILITQSPQPSPRHSPQLSPISPKLKLVQQSPQQSPRQSPQLSSRQSPKVSPLKSLVQKVTKLTRIQPKPTLPLHSINHTITTVANNEMASPVPFLSMSLPTIPSAYPKESTEPVSGVDHPQPSTEETTSPTDVEREYELNQANEAITIDAFETTVSDAQNISHATPRILVSDLDVMRYYEDDEPPVELNTVTVVDEASDQIVYYDDSLQPVEHSILHSSGDSHACQGDQSEAPEQGNEMDNRIIIDESLVKIEERVEVGRLNVRRVEGDESNDSDATLIYSCDEDNTCMEKIFQTTNDPVWPKQSPWTEEMDQPTYEGSLVIVSDVAEESSGEKSSTSDNSGNERLSLIITTLRKGLIEGKDDRDAKKQSESQSSEGSGSRAKKRKSKSISCRKKGKAKTTKFNTSMKNKDNLIVTIQRKTTKKNSSGLETVDNETKSMSENNKSDERKIQRPKRKMKRPLTMRKHKKKTTAKRNDLTATMKIKIPSKEPVRSKVTKKICKIGGKRTKLMALKGKQMKGQRWKKKEIPAPVMAQPAPVQPPEELSDSDDSDELPRILPPKRRRLQNNGSSLMMMQNSVGSKGNSSERIMREFPRHNWLEQKINQLQQRTSCSSSCDEDIANQSPVHPQCHILQDSPSKLSPVFQDQSPSRDCHISLNDGSVVSENPTKNSPVQPNRSPVLPNQSPIPQESPKHQPDQVTKPEANSDIQRGSSPSQRVSPPCPTYSLYHEESHPTEGPVNEFETKPSGHHSQQVLQPKLEGSCDLDLPPEGSSISLHDALKIVGADDTDTEKLVIDESVQGEQSEDSVIKVVTENELETVHKSVEDTLERKSTDEDGDSESKPDMRAVTSGIPLDLCVKRNDKPCSRPKGPPPVQMVLPQIQQPRSNSADPPLVKDTKDVLKNIVVNTEETIEGECCERTQSNMNEALNLSNVSHNQVQKAPRDFTDIVKGVVMPLSTQEQKDVQQQCENNSISSGSTVWMDMSNQPAADMSRSQHTETSNVVPVSNIPPNSTDGPNQPAADMSRSQHTETSNLVPVSNIPPNSTDGPNQMVANNVPNSVAASRMPDPKAGTAVTVTGYTQPPQIQQTPPQRNMHPVRGSNGNTLDKEFEKHLQEFKQLEMLAARKEREREALLHLKKRKAMLLKQMKYMKSHQAPTQAHSQHGPQFANTPGRSQGVLAGQQGHNSYASTMAHPGGAMQGTPHNLDVLNHRKRSMNTEDRRPLVQMINLAMLQRGRKHRRMNDDQHRGQSGRSAPSPAHQSKTEVMLNHEVDVPSSEITHCPYNRRKNPILEPPGSVNRTPPNSAALIPAHSQQPFQTAGSLIVPARGESNDTPHAFPSASPRPTGNIHPPGTHPQPIAQHPVQRNPPAPEIHSNHALKSKNPSDSGYGVGESQGFPPQGGPGLNDTNPPPYPGDSNFVNDSTHWAHRYPNVSYNPRFPSQQNFQGNRFMRPPAPHLPQSDRVIDLTTEQEQLSNAGRMHHGAGGGPVNPETETSVQRELTAALARRQGMGIYDQHPTNNPKQPQQQQQQQHPQHPPMMRRNPEIPGVPHYGAKPYTAPVPVNSQCMSQHVNQIYPHQGAMHGSTATTSQQTPSNYSMQNRQSLQGNQFKMHEPTSVRSALLSNGAKQMRPPPNYPMNTSGSYNPQYQHMRAMNKNPDQMMANKASFEGYPQMQGQVPHHQQNQAEHMARTAAQTGGQMPLPHGNWRPSVPTSVSNTSISYEKQQLMMIRKAQWEQYQNRKAGNHAGHPNVTVHHPMHTAVSTMPNQATVNSYGAAAASQGQSMQQRVAAQQRMLQHGQGPMASQMEAKMPGSYPSHDSNRMMAAQGQSSAPALIECQQQEGHQGHQRIPSMQMTPAPPRLHQFNGSCVMCGALAMYLCSNCRMIWYCSQTCQNNHWKRHGAECKPAAPMVPGQL